MMPCESCASSKSPDRSRTLVLCFDGTSNEFGRYKTNVVKLYKLLRKDKPEEQLTYYQPGIGTYFDPGVVSPLFKKGATVLDEAVAWSIGGHVRGGYRFLAQNYREGDIICLFGFSRGAYTARALAGFLHKIGLLYRDNKENIPFAYRLYKRTDDEGIRCSNDYKKTFCRDVPVDFIGVWDTVASVGLFGTNLPFTNTHDGIKVFRHALSLDEGGRLASAWFIHRSKFKPNTCQILPEERDAQADVFEVWFAGCHTDVGGGAVKDGDEKHELLSQISLHWMIDQVRQSQCRVILCDDEKADNYLPKKESSECTKTSFVEQFLENGGVKDQIHDQLKNWRSLWWILEFIPTVQSSQQNNKDWKWKNSWGLNIGRGRRIPDEAEPHIHATVEQLQKSCGYKPRASGWSRTTRVYVDSKPELIT